MASAAGQFQKYDFDAVPTGKWRELGGLDDWSQL